MLGVGVFSLGTKLCGKKDFTAPVSLLTVLGVMVSTVIASYISCAAGIGMPAHLFLVLLAVLSAVWQRRQLVMYWKKIKPVVLSWEGFFYFCFILFIAFFASRGEFHTDTNIYHAQNIRIYEEYGLIKGMGNLQQHFAYNSSYLAFAAVFSMKWLLGQSLSGSTFLYLCILRLEKMEEPQEASGRLCKAGNTVLCSGDSDTQHVSCHRFWNDAVCTISSGSLV